jgi:hypothetical protein
MELASMLAGERFSDHPRSVCPVIAAFLRSYNDQVDDCRRQDLYDYAAQSVGTRGSYRTRRVRAELCRRFVDRYEVTAPPRAVRLLWVGQAEQIGQRAGAAAALAEQPRGHSIALALLDALIACGAREDRAAEATTRVDRSRSRSGTDRGHTGRRGFRQTRGPARWPAS